MKIIILIKVLWIHGPDYHLKYYLATTPFKCYHQGKEKSQFSSIIIPMNKFCDPQFRKGLHTGSSSTSTPLTQIMRIA